MLVEQNFARSEAKSLVRLIGRNNETEQTILDLIRVSPEQEEFLREHLGNAPELRTALAQRVRIELEVVRLLERKPRSKARPSGRDRRIARRLVDGLRRGESRGAIARKLFPQHSSDLSRYQLSKFICKHSAAIEEAMQS